MFADVCCQCQRARITLRQGARLVATAAEDHLNF